MKYNGKNKYVQIVQIYTPHLHHTYDLKTCKILKFSNLKCVYKYLYIVTKRYVKFLNEKIVYVKRKYSQNALIISPTLL